MLKDSPTSTLDAIKEAIRSGATAEALGSSLARAAFLRMAHFHISNEFRDSECVDVQGTINVNVPVECQASCSPS